MAERKRTNNDLQNITQKTKDQVTRTPLNMYTDMYNKHTRVYVTLHASRYDSVITVSACTTIYYKMVGWFIVFNATFNNISVIAWWSVLFVEKTGVPGETTDLSQVSDKLYYVTL
jgi:hypothetical protein